MKRKKPKKRKDSRKGCCNDSKKHSYGSDLKHFGQQKQSRDAEKNSHEKSNNENSDALLEDSIRQTVFKELDKNPLLKPKQLCRLLGLIYKDYKRYVTTLRYQWKRSLKNRLGLKSSRFKNWRGWVYVPESLDRKKYPDVTETAVEQGWKLTKARNRYLLWKDPKRGRLEWHMSGRIKIWCKKPADRGRVNQMLVDAFLSTGLIFDIRIFEAFLRSVRFKGAVLIVETSERLPYLKIDFLKDSNGLIFKMGDASHPHCLEFNFFYPNYAEHSEAAVARLNKTLENLGKLLTPKPKLKKDQRMVV